ncbi:MAG: cytochrome P450, partial [Pseudomonadota bacterium]
IMISPWTLHRHELYWEKPDVFDPDRFMAPREQDILKGSYIPFGSGPHTCVGAGFATIEAVLILARLAREFDFRIESTDTVRPAARMTTRPSKEIFMSVRQRSM